MPAGVRAGHTVREGASLFLFLLACCTRRLAGFSTWGPNIPLGAPGVSILSDVSDSDTATATFSGTSMAGEQNLLAVLQEA
jgi:hypothetical protein